ncbi:hypothetical protein V495_05507 [Pseudogymnoascus sp. VKM F-4514 (FW-929)]|nr:hypothetical protein V495_05507 [Pseudogymnoascus sp. VKM F-4514 (FW-929)]
MNTSGPGRPSTTVRKLGHDDRASADPADTRIHLFSTHGIGVIPGTIDAQQWLTPPSKRLLYSPLAIEMTWLDATTRHDTGNAASEQWSMRECMELFDESKKKRRHTQPIQLQSREAALFLAFFSDLGTTTLGATTFIQTSNQPIRPNHVFAHQLSELVSRFYPAINCALFYEHQGPPAISLQARQA